MDNAALTAPQRKLLQDIATGRTYIEPIECRTCAVLEKLGLVYWGGVSMTQVLPTEKGEDLAFA